MGGERGKRTIFKSIVTKFLRTRDIIYFYRGNYRTFETKAIEKVARGIKINQSKVQEESFVLKYDIFQPVR